MASVAHAVPRRKPRGLLPTGTPLRLLDADGRAVPSTDLDMPGDEVLLCLFAGPEAEVRAVSERAGLPFERILPCVGLGWLARA